MIVLLGVGDDLFDIRWRHKIFIPAFAAIPLLIVYFVDFGVTQIVIPTPLRPYFGELFDLGEGYNSPDYSRAASNRFEQAGCTTRTWLPSAFSARTA